MTMVGRPRLRAASLSVLVLLPVLAACEKQPSASLERAERASAPAGGIFSDVTARSGIDFSHYNGATGEFYLPEILGAACSFVDYDRDGDLDIYAVQGALLGGRKQPDPSLPRPPERPPRNRLWRNDLLSAAGGGGDLFFTDVTERAGVGDPGFGMGCAVGDYDNDGYPDLYVTNFGPNLLFHNNRDGTFSDVSRQAGVGDPRFGASAAFLDYDRDGYLDLFVTNYADYSTAANRECTSLGGQPDYCGPLSYRPVSDLLFQNNGDGTFTDQTISAGIYRAYGYGLGVVCADFNEDGWIDIFVANDATPNQLWINRGDGTFEDDALVAGVAFNSEGRTEAGMGTTAGDFDRDRHYDLFLTHEVKETNTLYRNLGKGLFEDVTSSARLASPSLPYSGFGTRFFDYDNDGWLDLFVANGAVRKLSVSGGSAAYAQPDQLYHNEGGRFSETTADAGFGPIARTGRGVAFGDVDNDGDIDLVIANNNGPLRLLLNNKGNQRRWVRFLLEGTLSNRDGYGARVWLAVAGGDLLWQHVGTDGSYLSASDKRVHFGLGDAAAVSSVTVHWPAGGVERWTEVKVNAQTTLREGEGQPVEQ